MSSAFLAAAIQMVSVPSVEENLRIAGELVADAAARGAKLAVLPEIFAYMGLKDTDKIAIREPDGRGPIQQFLADTARRHRIWVVGGSVPLEASVTDKVRNTLLVYDDQGRRAARYDKIHLFGFENGTERYLESATIEAGERPLGIDTPLGRIGLSVCYDVRFPELYRALGPVDMILVPSAFTATTGRAHWETLLRARAIENLAYVIAPAQGGRHANGRETHGDSIIIDPWGEVLARRDKGAGVVIAGIDPARIARVRANLPALSHRTM